MLKNIILVVAIIIFATSNYGVAAKASQAELDKPKQAIWNWQNILPMPIKVDDPFAKLSKNQLDDLGYYVGLKQDIENIEKKSPNYEKLPARKAELDTLAKYLTGQGVDIEYLLSQRNKIIEARMNNAINVNPAVIDQTGSISGYVIPIRRDNDKLVEFFLVEENPFGHAGHDHSSPNPNQVIYVKDKEGITVFFKKLMTLTGELKQQQHTAKVVMVDGHSVDMEASYQLDLISYHQQ